VARNKERERQLARARYERRQQRAMQHRQQTRHTAVIVVSVVAVLAVIAGVALLFTLSSGGSSSNKLAGAGASRSGTPSASGSASPSVAPTGSASTGACAYTKAGQAARKVGLPPANPARQVVGARIALNSGTLAVTLDGTKAPCTVNSFTYLAEARYFDGVPCHRLTTQGIFVLQCGDPTGSGSGGPGYQFPDENLGSLGVPPGQQATYPAGTLAMANAGPGTNGSQFFIVYKDSPLAASYTPFGKITKGLDVVQKIAGKGTTDGSGDGKPKSAVTIKSIQILQ
jgi:peptidyl-prolyl cis-trans isomerase B (cyclophilin B)